MREAKPMNRLRQSWSRMNGAHVLAVLCALYETVIVTRLLLVPHIANSTLRVAISANTWTMPSFVLIVVVAVVGIWFCRRWPFEMLLAETALLLLVSALYGSAFSYLSVPWAVALYFAASGNESMPLRVCGLTAAGLLGLGSVVLATVWHQDSGLTNFLYPLVLLYVIFVATGMMVRNCREHRRSEQALHDEQERGEKLALQRDKAVRQSRIAAELHDSVGHDLTAIIALSEGLDDVSDKPEIDDAIGMINDLARQGLADTRTAVKALQPDNQSKDGHTNQKNSHSAVPKVAGDIERDIQSRNAIMPIQDVLHDWDDIEPILGHSRQIGIATALTETGRRPQDPQQADLSFIITRESITNAIRHGQGVSRIVVSWDHDGRGGIAIAVRDNGKSADGPNQDNVVEKNSAIPNGQKDETGLADSQRDAGADQPGFKHADAISLESIEHSDGTGLTRLEKSVERVSGTFAAGPDADGWTVKAYIPSLTEPVDRQFQGGVQI
ncbi:histidine kinase [Bifidobacterium sp. ESL0800]|uniref:sensor histidine kinase n=1 Tax=Bifidobacterium sp. ESL0800 TaxID=2983236 RepID=UPI0023F6F3C3|nr:histidine kinase [Bifidobacterium sp. ESL0800]WEV76150.1 histidine kinase [Bifidobacterium sp. ESL0800]